MSVEFGHRKEGGHDGDEDQIIHDVTMQPVGAGG